MTQSVPLFIQGSFVESQSNEWIDVTNPATGEVIARLPCATPAEMTSAIASASEAFQSWKEVAV
ncbi:Methylmalonate semialdehyde dehydrogenase [acylating] [Vibrio vulnificus]|nr:Methylmalonate semialdehyde dehydrogenase [acylating] [Vibrio vulnificus]